MLFKCCFNVSTVLLFLITSFEIEIAKKPIMYFKPWSNIERTLYQYYHSNIELIPEKVHKTY